METKIETKTWHQRHREKLSWGQVVADKVAGTIGSWPFIIAQTIVIIIWIIVNLAAYWQHWDPYPFILLNLLFSTQAAYAAPIIMMSQNRQNERDRIQAKDDYETNVAAKKEIEELQRALARIENEKLDIILKKIERK
jgi:uncharacterized membrane protein